MLPSIESPLAPLWPALVLTLALALAVRGAMLLRDRGPIARLEGPAGPRDNTSSGAPLSRLRAAVGERLAPLVLRLMGARGAEKVRAQLDAAGRPGGTSVADYARQKAVLLAAAAAAGILFLAAGSALPAIGLLVLGWIWPDVRLARAARVRQAAIDSELPDFLDILSVSVSAGVAFRPALARVAEAVGGPLGEEARTTLHQIELGATRREAFESLRRRNQSEPLSQFVTAFLQAEELGVPLTESLVELARDMRRDAYQRARRRAQRAAPRVSLIATTFLVPGALLLIITGLFVGSDIDLGDLFS